MTSQPCAQDTTGGMPARPDTASLVALVVKRDAIGYLGQRDRCAFRPANSSSVAAVAPTCRLAGSPDPSREALRRSGRGPAGRSGDLLLLLRYLLVGVTRLRDFR